MNRTEAATRIEEKYIEEKSKLACFNACHAWDINIPFAYEHKFNGILAVLLEGETAVNKDRGLVRMVDNNNIQFTIALLEAGADVHTIDDYPIRKACVESSIELVKVLMDYGADPYAMEGQAFVSACKQGRQDIYDLMHKIADSRG